MIESPWDAIDTGIRRLVARLNGAGVATLESCQGGPEHTYPVPWLLISGGCGHTQIEAALTTEGRRGLRLSHNREIETLWYEGDERPRRQWRKVWHLWLEPWPKLGYGAAGPLRRSLVILRIVNYEAAMRVP